VVTGSTRSPAATAKEFPHTTHVPAWLASRCGAAFGFGNSLVTFTSEGTVAYNTIAPKQLDTEASDFVELYKNNQFEQICLQKEATAIDQDEKDQWKIIRALLSDTTNETLLEVLGYDKSKITKNTEDYTGKKRAKKEKKKHVTE
jgi:hypothetical protein